MSIPASPEIQTITLSEIYPDPENPREISEAAISGLSKSLERFGYVDLLVVNKRDMRLVSGHQRLKVLTAAGIQSAPVIFVDLDEPCHKALAITLNSQEIIGQWTAAIIPLLERLRLEMPEEYILLRLKELRDSVANLEREQPGFTDPDDVPDGKPPTQINRGDLFNLGSHRLMCGDGTNIQDLDRLMGGGQG